MKSREETKAIKKTLKRSSEDDNYKNVVSFLREKNMG